MSRHITFPKDSQKQSPEQPVQPTEPKTELIPIAVLIAIYVTIGFLAGCVVGFIFITYKGI